MFVTRWQQEDEGGQEGQDNSRPQVDKSIVGSGPFDSEIEGQEWEGLLTAGIIPQSLLATCVQKPPL